MKLYVFGNEYLEQDSMARKVAKHLQKLIKNIEVVHCRSPDDLLSEDDIIILDVVKDIKEPVLVEDIGKLKTGKIISMHDFDLGFFLKLIDKIGIKKNIKIVGVPSEGNPEIIARNITRKMKWLME